MSSLDDDDVNWDEVDRTRYVVSSTVFVVCLDVVQYPLELIRTRLQYDCAKNPTGVLKDTKAIMRSEGIRGLFKGFVAARAFTLPGSLAYFGGYELIKDRLSRALAGVDPSLQPGNRLHDLLAAGTAGILADCLSLIFYTPGDIVSQRIQVDDLRKPKAASATHRSLSFLGHPGDVPQSPPKTTTTKHIRTILRTEGLLGFYRGFGVALLTYGPYSGLWFSCYELCKHSLNAKLLQRQHGLTTTAAAATTTNNNNNNNTAPHKKDLHTLVHVVAGATAGLVATIATNPMDIVRTRYQLLSAQEVRSYAGHWNTLRSIVRHEGLRSLWKGCLPSLVINVPGSALTFAGYELAKRFSLKDDAL